MKGFSEFRMPQAVFYGIESLSKLGVQAALFGKKP